MGQAQAWQTTANVDSELVQLRLILTEFYCCLHTQHRWPAWKSPVTPAFCKYTEIEGAGELTKLQKFQ